MHLHNHHLLAHHNNRLGFSSCSSCIIDVHCSDCLLCALQANVPPPLPPAVQQQQQNVPSVHETLQHLMQHMSKDELLLKLNATIHELNTK